MKITLIKRCLEGFPWALRLYVSRTGAGVVQIAAAGALLCSVRTSRPREAEALYLDGERHNRIVHDASLVTGFTEAGIRSDPGR